MANMKLIQELIFKYGMKGGKADIPSIRRQKSAEDELATRLGLQAKGGTRRTLSQEGPGPESIVDSADDLTDQKFNQFQRALIEEGEVRPPRTPDEIKRVREQLEDFDQRPNVFGEEDIGTAATREAIENEQPRNLARKQKRVQPGQETMDSPESQEQMNNFFGEEDAREVSRIQDELDTDPVLRSLSDKGQREITENLIVPRSVRAKEVNKLAKEAFEIYDNLADGMSKPPIGASPSDTKQFFRMRNQLQALKYRLSIAAKVSRANNDTIPLQSMIEEMLAPPQGKLNRAEDVFPTLLQDLTTGS
jgi:hypothetical protein